MQFKKFLTIEHVPRITDFCICVYVLGYKKPKGNRPLGRPRRRWVDNIRMDLQEVGMWACGLDWAGPG